MSIDEDMQNLFKLLKLADKYDVRALVDALWEPMAFYMNKMSQGRLDENEKIADKTFTPTELLEYAQTIINIRGAYPKELYEAFALAYQAFENDGENTAQMKSFMRENNELAYYMVDFMCAKLVSGRKAMKAQEAATRKVLEAL